MLAMSTQLNLDAEPRIKRSPIDETPKAEHPFFWAGYLLIDTGQGEQKSEPVPEKPAKSKKPP
jgi:hypothetical protein